MPENVYLSWELDPVLIGGLLTAAVLFALAAGPLRARLAPGRPFPFSAATGFYGALALTYLVEGSPLHNLADIYSLTAHMVQHLAMSYLVAPLLLWTVPTWMLRPLLLNRVVAPVARLLTRPLIAFSVFGFFFAAWHVPAIYDAVLRNQTLHHVTHAALLFTSLVLWWPIMSRLSELPRPSYLIRLLYLFLIPVAQLPVFGVITFAGRPIYETYANSPWTLGMDVVSEQALAGAVMKVAGLFVFGIPFAVTFFQWYQEETAPRSARPQRTVHASEGALPSASSTIGGAQERGVGITR